MKEARIYPSSVSQLRVNERKDNPFSGAIRAVSRNGFYEGYNCGNRSDPRYFHEWTNAQELTRGREIQCGRPSNYHCNHRTYYNIAGYRNTCPIAGCSGTYFQPAILCLEFSEEHLGSYNIKKHSKISSIIVEFSHRSLGVDVSNSSTTSRWGPNFSGFSMYPHLKVLKIYVTDKNGNQKGTVFEYNENPPLNGYSRVTAELTGITYEDLLYGKINIEYQRNLSTNPGNIYIKDLFTTVRFTSEEKYIMPIITQNPKIYTSTFERCATKFIYKMKAMYVTDLETKTPIPPAEIEGRDLRDEIVTRGSAGIKYTKEYTDNNEIIFHIQDRSGVAGKKRIWFKLRDSPTWDYYLEFQSHLVNQNVSLSYTKFIHKNVYPDASEICFAIKGESDGSVCFEKIEVYADYKDNLIFTFNSDDFDYYNENNVIRREAAENCYIRVGQLGCGKHTLWFKYSDDHWVSFDVFVVGNSYNFEVFIDEADVKTYDEDDICVSDNNQTGIPLDSFDFTQCKRDDIRLLSIRRKDDVNNINPPKFKFVTDTNYQNKEKNSQNTINKGLQVAEHINIDKNHVYKFDTSVKYPGAYTLRIYAEDNCLDNIYIHQSKINIKPNHKQNHDILYVRGEDSTSFKYKYLVAWEGDNIDEPLQISSIDVASTIDDVRVCVETEEFFTGLSEIGVAKLKVSNVSNRTLKNIHLELNVLVEDDYGQKVVTLDEFFRNGGVFGYLESFFNQYNKDNINNLSIHNLPNSIDEDLINEENVEIWINELSYDEDRMEGDTVEILIPFMSRTDKTVYIQPLLFEEPVPLYKYDDCKFKENPIEYFKLTVYDSILTDLSIDGENDLLDINRSFKECPDECFTTDLTYKIMNIDTSDTQNVFVHTKISNDNNLIPYKFGYYITEMKNNKEEKTFYEINAKTALNKLTEDGKIRWNFQERTRKQNLSYAIVKATINFPNEEKYTMKARTDKNGNVLFKIPVPKTLSKTYTINKLLSEVVRFDFDETSEYQKSCLYVDGENTINTLNDGGIKNQVLFDYAHTYKRYKAGDYIPIKISLIYLQKFFDNSIDFNASIKERGTFDELIVSYSICNLQHTERNIYNEPVKKYNQGILETVFETDDFQLIKNKTSKTLYCGIDTSLDFGINIEKSIVEQNELNVINVKLTNKVRDNKEVKCIIDLTPYSSMMIGEYGLISVDIEDGDYQLIEEDGRTYINWSIGEMSANTEISSKIILKGKIVGLSKIPVTVYDYLHKNNDDVNHHFGERICPCNEENGG